MPQFFRVQIIVKNESGEPAVLTNEIHFAKDYQAPKRDKRLAVIDGAESATLQLTAGKEQFYAYFSHPKALEGKAFYVKLNTEEYNRLNAGQAVFQASFLPHANLAGKAPIGYETRCLGATEGAPVAAETEAPAPDAYVNPASATEPAPTRQKRERTKA